MSLRVASLAGCLAVLPVLAQQNPQPPPPLPPLPSSVPQRAVPVNPNRIPLAAPVAPGAVASPAVTPSPIPGPAPIAPIQVVQPATDLAPPVTQQDPNALKWDAEVKEYNATAGDTNAQFAFWLTNVSSADVLINSVRTSCGCTVAKLPAQPWRIAPGSNGPIEVTVNLVGKSGLIAKGVTVDTSVGVKQLTVKANIPVGAGGVPAQVSGTMNDTERLKNMQLALADRQVVFKNQECAKCHADPAKGKTDGRLVYAAVCATCHNSHLRAAMVPDLRTLPHPTDADHWRKWITYGRAGSMMPAFGESEGGPLNEQQVTALVDFMVKAFPSRPAQRAGQTPGPAAQATPSPTASVGALPPPRAN